MRDLDTFLVLSNGRIVFDSAFLAEIIRRNEPELTDQFLTSLNQDLGARPDLADAVFDAIKDKAFDPAKPGHALAAEALVTACSLNPSALAEKALFLARMRLTDRSVHDKSSALDLIGMLIAHMPAHGSRFLESESLLRDLAKTMIDINARPADSRAAQDCLSALMAITPIQDIGVRFAERTLSCFWTADALAGLSILPFVVKADMERAETALDIAAEGLRSRDTRVQIKALDIIEEITSINRHHDFTALGYIVPLSVIPGPYASPVCEKAWSLRNHLVRRRPELRQTASVFYEQASCDLKEPLGAKLRALVSLLAPQRFPFARTPRKRGTLDPSS